jgi:uncharacterized protein (TIGR03032 family)
MTEKTESPSAPAGMTAVNYEYSRNFPAILQSLGASLLVSTYQAGKLAAIGAHDGALAISFHNFEQAMGVAYRPGMIAVGTRRQIWFLKAAHELAGRIDPPGKYDACFLTRSCHFTGAIHGHEMFWSGEDLWVVNTLFSCLCTLHPDFSFVPRWRPPFISTLAGEDRCHLNGLAMLEGKPRYVTAMAETDTAAGWRLNKATTGCLIEVESGRTVARGFAMPHSPRIHNDALWVLDSGNGRLSRVDASDGKVEPVAHVMGYTRGLALHGQLAFVGMSRIRETSVFGGIPIAERREELECGVAVIELSRGEKIAGLRFHSGVEEIFDVKLVPGIRCPVLSGPLPDHDGTQTIWLAPSM